MQPRVSVIICTYNYGHFIRQCLESVARQTRPVDEVIVVDDGSADNTPEVVREFSGVRYLRQENAGKSAAFNRGFAASSGDLICHLDADDYWLPNKVEGVLGALKQGDVGGLTHDAFYVDGTGAPLYGSEAQAAPRQLPRRVSLRDLLLMGFTYHPWNCPPRWRGVANTIVVWREAVSDILPVPESLGLTIDGALLLAAARRALIYLPERLSAYRHHNSNFYVRDPSSGQYQVRLLKWAPGILGVGPSYDKKVLQALALDAEVHSALVQDNDPAHSAAKAVSLIRRLVLLGLIPHWKNFALPAACLLRWRKVRNAFTNSV
jgi:glycosyltransferase involved in cell wall biosynthesis